MEIDVTEELEEIEKTLVEMEREKLPDQVPVQCYHCGYKWTYKGKNPFYAKCPACKRDVKLDKARTDIEEEPEPEEKKTDSLRNKLDEMDYGESLVIERGEDFPIKIEKGYTFAPSGKRLLQRVPEYWISERKYRGVRGKLIRLYDEDLEELERTKIGNKTLTDQIIKMIDLRKTSKEKFEEFLQSTINKSKKKLEEYGSGA